MKKRIVSLLLSLLLMTGALAGCTGQNKTTTGNNDDGAAPVSPVTEESGGEVKKIVFAFPTWAGPPPDLALIEEAMNEISREAIGIEAELLVIDYASYQQQIPLMMSGSEQLDVISTLQALYIPAILNGQLLDLEQNDLIQTWGQGIYEQVGQTYIDACRINGTLYGVPNNRDLARGAGASAIRTDLLEGIGYEFKGTGEIEYITQEEMDDIFARIHEAYPEIEVYRPLLGTMQQYTSIDALGGNVFGILENYGAQPQVANLFEAEEYIAYCRRMHDYYNKGYIGKDAATDTTAHGELVKSGKLASFTCGGKPGIKVQVSKECNADMTIVQVNDDFIASSSVATFPWAIPQNTADPVVAMRYLDFMYTNSHMMNLITWGIEGMHYELQGDGTIDYPAGVDASSSGYNHDMSWLFPNQFITHVWAGNPPDLWDQVKRFNAEATMSCALGFSFDTSELSTELAAVQNLYEEYQKSLEFGIADPDTALPELVEKMKSAGLPKIMEAKQAQFDQWLAEK